MKGEMRLSELSVGERCVVCGMEIEGAMRRRLLDLGVVEGNEILCVGKSPMRDPAAYLIGGAVVAIRRRDAARICVKGGVDLGGNA